MNQDSPLKNNNKHTPFSWEQFFTHFKIAPIGLSAFFIFNLLAFIATLLYIASPGFRDITHNTIGGPYTVMYFSLVVLFMLIYNNGGGPKWYYWYALFLIFLQLTTEGWTEYVYYIEREIFFWKYDTRYWRYVWNFAIPIFWLGVLLTKKVWEYFKVGNTL